MTAESALERGEEENVSTGKQFMISTKENSDHKWQNMPTVVGCLEVPSVPDFQPHAKFIARPVEGRLDIFQACLEKFDALQLRSDFANACDSVVPSTCCCGLFPDEDDTIRNVSALLASGWGKNTNRLLKHEQSNFQVDVFLWSWHNVTGKTETIILLIRFLVPSLKTDLRTGSS
jgi:hypothetical protein